MNRPQAATYQQARPKLEPPKGGSCSELPHRAQVHDDRFQTAFVKVFLNLNRLSVAVKVSKINQF